MRYGTQYSLTDRAAKIATNQRVFAARYNPLDASLFIAFHIEALHRQAILLFCLIYLVCASAFAAPAGTRGPSFVIITHGFWGSMDRLPTDDPAWLEASPHPHYRKHQETPFLTGPDYRPIPQRYLRFSIGPSLSRLMSQPYLAMTREFAYWTKRINTRCGYERVRIIPDWQTLENGGAAGGIGEINLIYLKFDWRLGLPQIVRDYIGPLLDFLGREWPEAEIGFVGHSTGGVVGRYAACRYPGRLASLVTVGAPHYGLYEVGRQSKGYRTAFGGDRGKERAQALGIWGAERLFFGTRLVRLDENFLASVVEFTRRYIPGDMWMDPENDLLTDGFGNLPVLEKAVPQAIALYGLGYGAYDLAGEYRPELPESKDVGPCLGPEGGPPAYALTGDGRVDPISARGPCKIALCLGKEKPHANLMQSSLVLTFLLDRYLFDGAMPEQEMRRSIRRLGAEWQDEVDQRLDWLLKARGAWQTEDNPN